MEGPDHPETCLAVRLVLGSMSEKWTIIVLGLLAIHILRFIELRRGVPGISYKMLAQTLRRAERDGLIDRTIFPMHPLKVEYALSVLGRTLTYALRGLRDWASLNAVLVREAQSRFDDAACGAI